MRLVEHHPPHYQRIPEGEPVSFLGGPIQGAPQWQNQAIEVFQTMPDDAYTLHVANPRRPGRRKKVDYNEQVDWEEFHLERAADMGGVLFWFAKQDPDEPYEEGRAYAQTTRIEIGEIFGQIKCGQDIHTVIGFEPGYQGGSERYIRKRAGRLDIPVVNKLQVACKTLVGLIESTLE